MLLHTLAQLRCHRTEPCHSPFTLASHRPRAHGRLWLYVRELANKRRFLDGLRGQQPQEQLDRGRSQPQPSPNSSTSRAAVAEPWPRFAGAQPPPLWGPAAFLGAATLLVLLTGVGTEVMVWATPAPFCHALAA
jgi:hypothetical protein